MIETMLTLPDGSRPKFYRITLDGRRLIRMAWTEGKTPRETVADLDVDDDRQARLAFEKIRDKQMRAGFCRVTDITTAVRGDTVLEFLVPNRSWESAFDLSPDGRALVVGTILKDGYGAEIHLVDIATGRRRLLHTEPLAARLPQTKARQAVLHAVHFDASGERIVYALNDETRLLDPATGQARTLARHGELPEARVNAFCVRPSWDRTRNRLLVVNAGNRVQVLDRQWDIAFETGTSNSPFECTAGALSPSGCLLALCHSRGRRRGGDGKATEVEVWDIDQGVVLARVPMDGPIHKIGFDPTESLLLAKGERVNGPCAFSRDTGALAWYFPSPFGPERWATCYGWEYSPDGNTLAIGRWGHMDVVDASTRRADPAFGYVRATGVTGRTYGIRFSGDGTLVASGDDAGRIVVRKL